MVLGDIWPPTKSPLPENNSLLRQGKKQGDSNKP